MKLIVIKDKQEDSLVKSLHKLFKHKMVTHRFGSGGRYFETICPNEDVVKVTEEVSIPLHTMGNIASFVHLEVMMMIP